MTNDEVLQLYQLHLGAKLDLLLKLLDLGHQGAVADLAPEMHKAILNFRMALGAKDALDLSHEPAHEEGEQ